MQYSATLADGPFRPAAEHSPQPFVLRAQGTVLANWSGVQLSRRISVLGPSSPAAGPVRMLPAGGRAVASPFER